jgi:hypothetical protein
MAQAIEFTSRNWGGRSWSFFAVETKSTQTRDIAKAKKLAKALKE